MSDYLALSRLARSIEDLTRFSALERAYKMSAADPCYACGLPATKMATDGPGLEFVCDSCRPPEKYECRDTSRAAAVRRLMRIARVEHG